LVVGWGRGRGRTAQGGELRMVVGLAAVVVASRGPAVRRNREVGRNNIACVCAD